MDEGERNVLTEQSVVLRQELKVWEREFAAGNGGMKAGREDIKQNSHLAQKYKDYNRIRDILAGKIPAKPLAKPKPKTSETTTARPSKRKSPSNTHGTPAKRRAAVESQTPSQIHPQPSTAGPFDTPSANRLLFTPQKPRVIGPTPQKDGKFLGIFDAVPSGDEVSPLKQPAAPTDAPSIQETPRKSKDADGGIVATPSAARHSRTPLSSSKRFLLDTFVTPLKRRRGSNEGSVRQASLTPSSVSKLNLSTPSFLRRDNRIAALPAIIEDSADALSPPAPRMPKRSLVRGLSSMLASLREMQEEALDDDLDALREMESGPPPPNAAPKQVLPKPQAPKLQESVQVRDSQQLTDFPFIDFPDLDFNNDGKDEDDELGEREQAIADRDSKLPVYKKKGQKRTTRKVNIRPSRAKAPAQEAAPTTCSDDEDDEYDAGQDDTQGGDTQNPDLVPDTQEGFEADSLPLYKAVRNFDSGSDNSTQYTASEGGTRYKRSKQKTTGRRQKIGAQVHTNYKRMKLKNSGAKGGRVGGKFGRRR
ncbi:DNA replication regulator sld2 [Pseudogymnoascus destructans]|uniref:DNA replication regulator SLD2 n=2 Tax=Pseudogymnoascus destructans TaxID=655981 RepID=L8FR97_PSED2|nr:DNA replication regulator sld2 [Pseudogymnoascus destructans]ELR03427.1 hypothetical protein GMDG_06162 [Pseudogymnoascus destructans 20631-21]OAF56717.1 DNA replication regulator sld2 [Pseudogymnoascus destructans]